MPTPKHIHMNIGILETCKHLHSPLYLARWDRRRGYYCCYFIFIFMMIFMMMAPEKKQRS